MRRQESRWELAKSDAAGDVVGN